MYFGDTNNLVELTKIKSLVETEVWLLFFHKIILPKRLKCGKILTQLESILFLRPTEPITKCIGKTPKKDAE